MPEPGRCLLEELLAQAGSGDAPAIPSGAVLLGRYTGVDAHGAPLVCYPGGPARPVPAQTLVPPTDLSPQGWVALTLPRGSQTPLILGQVRTGARTNERGVPLAVVVEGDEIVLQADRKLTLRCGAATLTLTADGQVLTRGAYITSHASGTQRIRGAAVRIN